MSHYYFRTTPISLTCKELILAALKQQTLKKLKIGAKVISAFFEFCDFSSATVVRTHLFVGLKKLGLKTS